MKKPWKIILLILLAAAILFGILAFVVYQWAHRYEPENYIGRTAQQIIIRYGKFDRSTTWESTGNYRTGIYIVKPKVVGYLGTYNEEYFLIRFDENGVAYDCEYVVTGAGG